MDLVICMWANADQWNARKSPRDLLRKQQRQADGPLFFLWRVLSLEERHRIAATIFNQPEGETSTHTKLRPPQMRGVRALKDGPEPLLSLTSACVRWYFPFGGSRSGQVFFPRSSENHTPSRGDEMSRSSASKSPFFPPQSPGGCSCTIRPLKPSSLAFLKCYFVFVSLPFSKRTSNLLHVYMVNFFIVVTCLDLLSKSVSSGERKSKLKNCYLIAKHQRVNKRETKE